jgi:hypothetical protein
MDIRKVKKMGGIENDQKMAGKIFNLSNSGASWESKKTNSEENSVEISRTFPKLSRRQKKTKKIPHILKASNL